MLTIPIYLFQLVLLITFIIACVAVPGRQNIGVQHINIVIVVLILFMAALGGLLHFVNRQSNADEYDVEQQTKGKNTVLVLYIIILPSIQ